MPRKRPSQSAQPSPSASADDMMRDLSRLLGRESFDSMDEVNAFLQREVMGKPLARPRPLTNQERAEDMVLAARDEHTAAGVKRQAAKALALDPECIDAHLLLAEVAETPVVALAHARDAVAAGAKRLADELAAGDIPLWYHPVGRSWLQARGVVAELLWQRGDRPLAIAEARAILERNPNDNAGMRYVLMDWLMQAGSVADIDQHLAAYHDDGAAAWCFSEALHRYRTEGAGAKARKALLKAMTSNRHVIPMLAGHRPMPVDLPDHYTIGGEDEAALYLQGSLAAWLSATGAMAWAIDEADRAKPSGTRRKKP